MELLPYAFLVPQSFYWIFLPSCSYDLKPSLFPHCIVPLDLSPRLYVYVFVSEKKKISLGSSHRLKGKTFLLF